MDRPAWRGSGGPSSPCRSWWVVGSVAVGDAGAQDESGDTVITVDRVDALADPVVAEGSVTGADPAQIKFASNGEELETSGVLTVGDGLRNDVVAVLDTTDSLGNATVQLAKQGLDPLMPGDGAVNSLGVITTGGSAQVEVGPTTSSSDVTAGLAGITPQGSSSATWDGLSRAAALLSDRSDSSVGTVVLFSAASEEPDAGAVARARLTLQQAGVRLQVVAMDRGTSIPALTEMVRTLGGDLIVVDSDEQLAGAFDEVAATLQGRFRADVAAPEGADALVPLTARSAEPRPPSPMPRTRCARAARGSQPSRRTAAEVCSPAGS